MRSSQNLADKSKSFAANIWHIRKKFLLLGANFRLNPSGRGQFWQLTAVNFLAIRRGIARKVFLVSCQNWLCSALAKPLRAAPNKLCHAARNIFTCRGGNCVVAANRKAVFHDVIAVF